MFEGARSTLGRQAGSWEQAWRFFLTQLLANLLQGKLAGLRLRIMTLIRKAIGEQASLKVLK